MLIDTLKEINEGRAESGRGSKAGREKFASKEGTQGRSVKAKKSRVKVYDTIDDALHSGAPYGTIFSTKAADRLYVISKPTWGTKSRAGGNTRIAKGFTPGSATPNATWPSIKSHAVRTMIKHGKTKAGRLTKKYGPGRDPDEGKPKKKKLKEAKYPKKSRNIAEILSLLTLIKRKFMERTNIVVTESVLDEISRSTGRVAAILTNPYRTDSTKEGPDTSTKKMASSKKKVGPKRSVKRAAPKAGVRKMASSKKKTKDKKSTPATASNLKAAKAKKEEAKKEEAKKEKQIKSDKRWGGGAAKIRLVKSVVKRLLPKPGFVRKAHGPVHK